MQKVKPAAEICCHCSSGAEATGTVQGTGWAAWADAWLGVQAAKPASSRRREARMVTRSEGERPDVGPSSGRRGAPAAPGRR